MYKKVKVYIITLKKFIKNFFKNLLTFYRNNSIINTDKRKGGYKMICKKCNIKIIAYNYVTLKKEIYCLHCVYVNSIENQKNFKKTIDIIKRI